MTSARVRSIAQLPPAGQLDGTEQLPVVQQGQTVATTTGAVARLGGGTGGGGSSSADDITSGTLDAARLPLSGVTAGTYGSGSLVPVITVDATGRLTSVATSPVAGGGSGGGSPLTVRHQIVTPTSGQTSFPISGGYTVGNILVFVDGYSALAGTDYTATNGTSVTITNPALDASDRVEFVLFDGGGSSAGPASTDALPEGTTNVYFTTARARAAISVSGSLAYNSATGVISYTAPTPYTLPAATTGALGGVKANAGTSGQFVAGVAADGSLVYATPAGGGSGGGPASTDQLTEGTTNLYFTQARARASVSATGSLAYNATTGVFSYTAPTLATVATSGSASDLTAGTLPVARLPAFTGDATSTAGSAALTLATVNANVGTYTNATLTVDAKGRLTAASSGSAGGTGTVTSSGTPTSGQLALFTTATNVQGVTLLPAANHPALTGDVTNAAGSLATTLAASGVAAGNYTSANITVDAKGRVTAAANGSSGGGGGKLVDRAYAEYTSFATLSASIPLDNTIPQSNEGTQILSTTITPKSTSNRIRAYFKGSFKQIGGSANIIGSIFIGSGSDATDAMYTSQGGGNGDVDMIVLTAEVVAGSMSAVTVSVRVGPAPNGGNAVLTNALGTAPRAVLIVEEIIP